MHPVGGSGKSDIGAVVGFGKCLIGDIKDPVLIPHPRKCGHEAVEGGVGVDNHALILKMNSVGRGGKSHGGFSVLALYIITVKNAVDPHEIGKMHTEISPEIVKLGDFLLKGFSGEKSLQKRALLGSYFLLVGIALCRQGAAKQH